MKTTMLRLSFLTFSTLLSLPSFSATPLDLSKQKATVLQSFATLPMLGAQENKPQLQEVKRSVDFNRTLHIRMKEMYAGYPVWGGDAIVHIPNGANTTTSFAGIVTAATQTKASLDGVVYQNLSADLANTPKVVFSKEQAQKALAHMTTSHIQKTGASGSAINENVQLIVYIDEQQKAHWAYKISFNAPVVNKKLPSKPIYLIDAISFHVYKQWDNIQTIELEDAIGGGLGGNVRAGQLTYDGMPNNLAPLKIKRDPATDLCYLQNAAVHVKRCNVFNYKHYVCLQSEDMANPCGAPHPEHNNVYWNGDFDAIKGAFSPGNDALYNGGIVKDLYKSWYDLNVLEEKGNASLLNMVTHIANFDNAFWDGEKMNFGDGDTVFYPLTSLGVTSHEISHGFTEQHSGLIYDEQSGAINESFSDMAALAAEFFATGKHSWSVGSEIFKEPGKALRYMDKPSNDCGAFGECSIDHASDYYPGLNVHYGSGVYNRFFYLLASTPGWDVKKAFDIVVAANVNYWTPTTDYQRGACGVVKAATIDYNYDVKAVRDAFAKVGINTSQC